MDDSPPARRRAQLNIGWGRIDDVQSFEAILSKGPEGNRATIEVRTSDLASSDIAYIDEASLDSL